MTRTILTFTGFIIFLKGIWELSELSRLVSSYYCYPNGDHLPAGGLFLLGLLIMFITNTIYSSKNREKIKKSQNSLQIDIGGMKLFSQLKD